MNKSFSRSFAEANGVKWKQKRDYDTRVRHDDGDTRSTHNISAFARKHFIAWDGEGTTLPHEENIAEYDKDGKLIATTSYQKYTLLMNNEGVSIVNPDGLSTMQCLDAIMNSTKDKKAIHVGFGFSYDANMILRDIPEAQLRKLHAGWSISYGPYNIEYRPRKSLTIRLYENGKKISINTQTGETKRNKFIRSITIWDVLGFFQSSFVEALGKYFTPKKGGNPGYQSKYKEIIKKIKEGKDRRSTFTEDEMESFIKPYCKLEVDALKELMLLLHSYLDKAGIVLSRWDGAGACAASALKKYKVKQHISIQCLTKTEMPDEVIEASEYAYFGGRIEVMWFGNYLLMIFHYDINSAYPAVMIDLPSFKDGRWAHMSWCDEARARVLPQVTLYRISWSMDIKNAKMCPFPWRDKDGCVYFPVSGTSWVYKPELIMAYDCFPQCKIEIHEVYSFIPGNDIKPFAFIGDLYELRKKFVREGNGAELVLKLTVNSLYGKTVQSLGYNKKTKTKPPFHNLVVGGMITSGTRAKMMRAAMQSPENIIMLATDGIYSKVPLDLPGIDSDEKRLGEWEAKTHDYMTLVMSGVYWLGNTNGEETSYSRGFDKMIDKRPLILEAWKNDENKKLAFPTKRFVTVGAAIGLNNFKKWCTWRTINREISLTMNSVKKRRVIKGEYKLYEELAPTYPYSPDVFIWDFYKMSAKYTFEWDAMHYEDGLPVRELVEEIVYSKE